MTKWTIPGPIRLFAPAKVNLSLEVCGQRVSGYHEVVTLIESISIYDVIDIAPSDRLRVVSDDRISHDDDLTRRALEKIAEHTNRKLCLSVTVRKHIPISAGLGGGSSDAGTVVQAVGSRIGLTVDQMHEIAASLGSDVPFFLAGGVALATETGTNLRPVRSPDRRWFVVAVPELEIPQKTAELYRALTTHDYSDGVRTRQIADAMEGGRCPDWNLRNNAFQRPLLQYPEFRRTVDALTAAGGEQVLASGAGPAAFTVCRSFEHARSVYAGAAAMSSDQAFIATSVAPGLNESRLRSK